MINNTVKQPPLALYIASQLLSDSLDRCLWEMQDVLTETGNLAEKTEIARDVAECIAASHISAIMKCAPMLNLPEKILAREVQRNLDAGFARNQI